jgi:hypothetical protein
MERYNKVYFAIWLLFTAITLAFTIVFVLNNLAGMLDVDETFESEGLALSFFLLFLASEVIGFILATSTIDRIPWLTHTISWNPRLLFIS